MCPYFPKSESSGNVIDISLSDQRKETQANMLRKIDLVCLFANKNMLCVVQITWHGAVKQRAATASHTSLGEIHITQTRCCICQENFFARTMVHNYRISRNLDFDLKDHQVPTLKSHSHA